MTKSYPRLPSGVYFSLLTDSAANEAHYVPEYPNFAPLRTVEEGGDPNPSSADTPLPQLCLPLVSVSINMEVDHSIAKTKVVQTFTNHGSNSIPEAWYSFPLYDGAAITAFRCEVGDDKVLEGKVKPTDEARQEFKRAVQKQEVAALVEEMTPEVFQTNIGNIPPQTTVRVEITYIEELHTDLGGDGIIVTIPTSVAPRYGMPPAGYAENSAVKETGLSLVVNVASSGTARDIACRSGHAISIDYRKTNAPEAVSFDGLAALENQPDSDVNPRHVTVRLSYDHHAMDRDFILFIPSPDEGLSRSQALLAASSEMDHAAMMVTVRPSELFSDLRESMNEFDGEILFLADRSGSMRGEKIEELKKALFVFLKSLPEKCRFNLYSFGSSVSSLWPHSMAYDEASMQSALDHISTFEADVGGTEVLNALRQSVSDRRSTDSSSTQIILLTDGQIWNAEEALEFVRMSTSNAEGQLRLFGLGLGNRVSHQLIQGIGFFGGGFGEVAAVDAAGKWKEAVIRILKGAIMPNSWSYSISLGEQWDEKRLDVDDISAQHGTRSLSESLGQISGESNPSFVRAPREIPLLHHFGQQSVYFLLDTTNEKLPEHVVITASSQHSGTKTATLQVTKATLNNTTIQHLAAKAAVRDLESHDASEASSSDLVRRNAEHLCQMYSISSKWTSFVAVSRLQQSVDHEDVEVSLYKAPRAELVLLTRQGVTPAGSYLAAEYRPDFTCTSNVVVVPSQQFQQSVYPRAAEGPSGPAGVLVGPQGPSDPFATSQDNNYLFSGSEDIQRASERRARSKIAQHNYRKKIKARMARQAKEVAINAVPRHSQDSIVGPMFGDKAGCLPAMDHGDVQDLDEPVDNPGPVSWEEVVRCQRIDGLFDLEKGLAHRMAAHFCHGTQQALGRWLTERLKVPASDENEESGSIELLTNTVMALAFLRSHYYLHRALWELIVQKAEWSLASQLKEGELDRPDGLSALADSALAHAHYGRYSQDNDQVDWWKCGPGGGRCGVCNMGDEGQLSAVGNNQELEECPFFGCEVSMSPWDRFWAHVTEQGHIHSSCGAAMNLYDLAEERISTLKREGQEPGSKKNKEFADGGEDAQDQGKRIRLEGTTDVADGY